MDNKGPPPPQTAVDNGAQPEPVVTNLAASAAK